jgi:hypothetical protein
VTPEAGCNVPFKPRKAPAGNAFAPVVQECLYLKNENISSF